MLIGIDNVVPGHSTSSATIGGMRHYLTDLCTWLPRLGPEHRYILFQPDWADPLSLPADSPVRIQRCRGVPKQRSGRVLYEQSLYAGVVERTGVDVFLATNSITPLRLRVPAVVVAQALQYVDFPEIYSWSQRRYLRVMAPAALRKAARVIALSRESRDIITQRFGVAAERVAVIPHALSSTLLPERQGQDDDRERGQLNELTGGEHYILSVGSFYGYKNIPRLVRAFALLRRRQAITQRLLLIGSDTRTVTRERLLAYAARLGVGDAVICPGRVAHESVSVFYDQADLMAAPSLAETFGHPVLEAMAHGCPVVTSDRGALAEVAGDCAVLVNPYSTQAIADGMLQALSDHGAQQRMAACGRRRAATFTQERRARAYLAILEEAARLR